MTFYCKRGHLMVRSNIRTEKNGERRCLTCAREREKKWWRELRKLEFPPHEFVGRTHCAECYRIYNRETMRDYREEKRTA